MTNTHVKSFVHLTKLKYAEKALPLLEKIASLVKPIMVKHGWTLPVLAEFLPNNPNLLGLNVNGGQKILIRLRPHHAQDTFLELDDLIGTMLHELTHNVHGPHDARFYAFLKVLTDEFDALQASGYTGEGFHSTGHRFGTSHNLPPHLAKMKALAAAEHRAKKARLMGPGGRLGGAGTMGKSMRELASEAARRRLEDDKTCGSGSGFDQAAEVIRAEREGTVVPNTYPLGPAPLPSTSPLPLASPAVPVVLDISSPSGSNTTTSSTEHVNPNAGSKDMEDKKPDDKEIIIIDDSDDDMDSPIPAETSLQLDSTKSKTTTTTTTTTTMTSDHRPLRPKLNQPQPQSQTVSQTDRPQKSREEIEPLYERQAQWSCPTCTFLNAQILPSCEMCETSRPNLQPHHQSRSQTQSDSKDASGEGWSCNICATSSIGLEWWCCTNPGCSGVRGWS